MHFESTALRWVCVALSLLLLYQVSPALEATHLEPAEGAEPGEFSVEQVASWEHRKDDVVHTETEIAYGLNRRLELGLWLPAEFGDGEQELGDIGLFVEGAFNPDAVRGPLVGGEIKLLLPTGEDSHGSGVEVEGHVSKYLGEQGKHGLHLTLEAEYASEANENDDDRWFDDDDEEREVALAAAIGYTYALTDRTELIADVFREESLESDEHETLAEFGMKHEFSDSIEGVLGVAVGLDEEAPDAIVKAGIEIKFGGKRRHRD